LRVETFATDNYLSRWVEGTPGDFRREPGRIVSQGSARCLLYYRQRLATGVALEFDGEILAGAPPGDLSVVWTDDDVLDTDSGISKPKTVWSLQTGAYNNLMIGIYRDWSQCVAGRPLSLRLGTKYHIRAEISEHSLRLFIDGELVAEYEDPFPLASGYLALFRYGPGKVFSNVKLYERGLPERLAPTAIGDAFFAIGDFADPLRCHCGRSQIQARTRALECAQRCALRNRLANAVE
jgi:hypothetical protein